MHVVGLGTDIVECLRIAKLIERHGELFIGRVYTEAEIEFCRSRQAATQHYAGRWAAKEAVLRALGTGWQPGLNWTDIEIRNNEEGKPVTAFRGAARDLVEQLGIGDLVISVSHCRTHAMATALAISAEEDL